VIREGEKEFSIGERGGCCGENRQNQENCAKWEKGKESGRTRALHWGVIGLLFIVRALHWGKGKGK
jgi:hypothetical protein